MVLVLVLVLAPVSEPKSPFHWRRYLLYCKLLCLQSVPAWRAQRLCRRQMHEWSSRSGNLRTSGIAILRTLVVSWLFIVVLLVLLLLLLFDFCSTPGRHRCWWGLCCFGCCDGVRIGERGACTVSWSPKYYGSPTADCLADLNPVLLPNRNYQFECSYFVSSVFSPFTFYVHTLWCVCVCVVVVVVCVCV